MSEIPFHLTRGGRHFYERDVPRLIEAIKDLTVEVRSLCQEVRASRGGGDDDPAAR